MTESRSGRTAVIYQFSDRARLVARKSRSLPVEAPRQEPQPVVWGGSWYHDEAIREAERDRKG